MFSDDAAMRQVQDWQRDPLLHELRATYRRHQVSDPLSGDWIVTTAPALQPGIEHSTQSGSAIRAEDEHAH